ncbi:hypothetical protein HYY75_06070 [bacterium]|nr:hypothetical protein [bacterium]
MLYTKSGVTLLEILLSLVILLLAILPIIQTFTQSYQLTGRQIQQETAVKVAEAAINKLMATRFDFLDNASTPVIVPLLLDLPGAPGIQADLRLEGNPAQGTGTFSFVNIPFKIIVEVNHLFKGPAGSPNSLWLSYAFNKFDDVNVPIATYVASYSCPDSFLGMNVRVRYTVNNQTVETVLNTCRANLNL